MKIGTLVKVDGNEALLDFGKTGVVVEVLAESANLDHRLTFCRGLLDNGSITTLNTTNFSIIEEN